MISAKKYWSLICSVQDEVNFGSDYKKDIDQYNRTDFWEVMGGKKIGDCEDYALTKRELLLKELPADCLRLATCWVENDRGYHAVLVVVTDEGDYVLDNRHQDIKSWENLPYKWDKMQDETGTWRAMG